MPNHITEDEKLKRLAESNDLPKAQRDEAARYLEELVARRKTADGTKPPKEETTPSPTRSEVLDRAQANVRGRGSVLEQESLLRELQDAARKGDKAKEAELRKKLEAAQRR